MGKDQYKKVGYIANILEVSRKIISRILLFNDVGNEFISYSDKRSK